MPTYKLGSVILIMSPTSQMPSALHLIIAEPYNYEWSKSCNNERLLSFCGIILISKQKSIMTNWGGRHQEGRGKPYNLVSLKAFSYCAVSPTLHNGSCGGPLSWCEWQRFSPCFLGRSTRHQLHTISVLLLPA
jgi:hypothetical protein